MSWLITAFQVQLGADVLKRSPAKINLTVAHVRVLAPRLANAAARETGTQESPYPVPSPDLADAHLPGYVPRVQRK